MAHIQDHRKDISIYGMVRNRLPFLDDTENNKALLSEFTLETMHDLETCLQLDEGLPEGESKVGLEENYSIPQQSLIADIVSATILQRNALIKAEGASGEASTEDTYVSKAGAGSAQVEFDQLDYKKTNAIAIGDMISMFKKSAITRGLKLGCYLVFLDEGGLTVACDKDTTPHPFIIVQQC